MIRAAAAALVLVGCAVAATPASAAIALVQKGNEASGGGQQITATLNSGTTAGDLLVATVQDLNSNCATDNWTAPAGWVKATSICRGGSTNGPAQIWYYLNVSAGITSVTFNTGSSGANSIAQLSEWSGVATSSPLDQTGTASNTNGNTSLTITTTGNISAAGELAITSFDTNSGLSSFAPGTNWNSILSDPGNGFDSDYLIGPASGSTLSETVTSSPQTPFGASIATFKAAACSGGSLSVEAPSSVSFPSVSLNAYTKSTTTTITVTPDDETGSGNGWQLDATSTTLRTGTYTLPTTATTITSPVSQSAATGNCSLPTNTVTYPVTLPAGASPPTAAAVYSANTGTGNGPTNVTLTASTSVPGNAHAGSYSSTWTLTMASGP